MLLRQRLGEVGAHRGAAALSSDVREVGGKTGKCSGKYAIRETEARVCVSRGQSFVEISASLT